MPREAGVFWDKRAKCWATSAIGEMRTTKGGKSYRAKVYNRELTDPKDRKRARLWLEGELERRDAGFVRAGRVSVEKLAQNYLYDVEPRVAPSTYLFCRDALNRALDWPSADDPNSIARMTAEDLTPERVQPMIDALLAEGASEVYVTKAVVSALKRMFSWGATVPSGKYPGLPLRSNPIAKLKGPAVPRRAFRDVGARSVSRFLRWAWRKALQERGRRARFDRALVLLILALRDTGARPKELCIAEWSELKQRPDGWGVIKLPWWKWKNGAKQRKPRLIAIPPHVMSRLAALRMIEGYHPGRIFARYPTRLRPCGEGESPESGTSWVWYDPKTRRSGDSKDFQKAFHRLVMKARQEGLDLPDGFRSYWLRSSFSTNAQRRGVGLSALAESMGTSEAMLARSYTDLGEEDVVGTAKGALGS